MEQRRNRRTVPKKIFGRQHLKLDDLREKAAGIESIYLFEQENIADYPRPEFRVSHLKHDTDHRGLCGIRDRSGFCNPFKDDDLTLQWWSLAVGPDEIQAAQKRLLKSWYPKRTKKQAKRQKDFLKVFATSPAFLESSRLGPYRFTLPLKEVLTAYSKQFCSGAEPTMRVFKTVLYSQELMYSVLVHSPANQERFSEYPLLTDDQNAVCAYKKGRFIWRSEAMCKTHNYKFVRRDEEQQVEVQDSDTRLRYYIWDNVAVALHVEESGQVLKFPRHKMRKNIKICDDGYPLLCPEKDFDRAAEILEEDWPEEEGPPEEEDPPEEEGPPEQEGPPEEEGLLEAAAF